MIRRNARDRRGSVLIYTFYLLTIMFAFVSFGVDFGHMQTVKTEMQRGADSTARAALQMYLTYGSSTAVAYAPFIASQTYNPDDGNSGQAPTVLIEWGSWNAATKVFTVGGSTPMAVRVTISRTTANGNAVPLSFPLLNGKSAVRQTCDVWAQAVAVLNGSSTVNSTISGQSNPWLAGMPNGSPAISDGDTAPAQSPPMVMTVVPGTVLTFTNVSGGVKHDPALQYDPATGDNSGAIYSHNCDDPMGEIATENNIGDVKMPLDALMGVFLTNNAPNTQPTPTTVRDYSTTAARDQATYSDIKSQQPFYIGTGKSSGGTTQQFVVPNGCTRLYLGTMDGHQWANNSGSFSATITQIQSIQLVK